MRTAVALLLLAASLVAAPVPKALKRPRDEDRIVGIWVRNPGETAGFAIYDDGSCDTGVGTTKKDRPPGRYKLDTTQSPKHIDWSPDGGQTWFLGVYELDGDSLRFNFGDRGSGVRPKVLGPNTGFQWEDLTRCKVLK